VALFIRTTKSSLLIPEQPVNLPTTELRGHASVRYYKGRNLAMITE